MDKLHVEAKDILPVEEFQDRSNPNNHMVGGNHYMKGDSIGTCPHCHKPVQHWDWAQNLRGLEYAATKYLARWREKDGFNSLKKVLHYTQKLIVTHFPGTVIHIVVERSTEQPTNVGSPSQPEAETSKGLDGLKSEDPHARVERTRYIDDPRLPDEVRCVSVYLGQRCWMRKKHNGPCQFVED